MQLYLKYCCQYPANVFKKNILREHLNAIFNKVFKPIQDNRTFSKMKYSIYYSCVETLFKQRQV